MANVSVIIPVFNAEKTLRRCVDSVLAQEYDDFELILVDDGSTDSTPEICASYEAADRRVKVCRKENGGVASARNVGLDHACGKWVAFADADDSVCPDWLSVLLSGIGLAPLVVCGYNRFAPGSDVAERNSIRRPRLYTEPDTLLEDLMKSHMLTKVWNKIFKKSVIDRNHLRFDESFRAFEDEYFVICYLKHVNDVVAVSDCCYNYYYPEDHMTRYDFSVDDFQKIVYIIYEFLAKVSGRVRLPSLVWWYRYSLIRYVQTHSFEESRPRIEFAGHLAETFHDNLWDFVGLRLLPERMIYNHLRKIQL